MTMADVEWMKRVIALNHVRAKGDAQTRELVETLRDDRAVVLKENESLQGEVSALREDVVNVHRSGLTPGARFVVGRMVAALVLVSGVAAVLLWYVGTNPLGRVQVSSGTDAGAGAVQAEAPAWVTPPVTFTSTGPPEQVQALFTKFGTMPSDIDTSVVGRVSVRYVDGPYTRMTEKEQDAQSLAIARYLWKLPTRPKGTEMISVRIERPVRGVGDEGVTRESLFLRAELSGK
ncbi:MAG: hypothetical protein JWM95_728 [Gemmatimonadetes bacterium]|nr:hypothetical protein [Gemmatimonadota bacterium]